MGCPHCGGAHASENGVCPALGPWTPPVLQALAPGQVLDGKYRIVREIGRGAMGVVHEAVHVALGRKVAIKTLLASASKDADLAARFEREARAASAIGHPHIVDVFDLGRTGDGAVFMVMEILAGRTLAAWLKEQPTLPVAVAVDLIAQVLSGLGAAHREGIVHRDLKPENIFIVRREDRPHFVKIVDFGISKILLRSELGPRLRSNGTAVGTVLGTPLYMSPEQILGQVGRIDHRADIYSAGVVLYEMLCGRTPFEGESQGKIFASILDGWYPRPHDLRRDIPATVEAAILRALERDMDKRFASALEMREAITGRRGDVTPSPDVAAEEMLAAAQTIAGRNESIRLVALGAGGAGTIAPQPPKRQATDPFLPLPSQEVVPELSREPVHSLSEPPADGAEPLQLARPRRASAPLSSSPGRWEEKAVQPSHAKRWIAIASAGLALVAAASLTLAHYRKSQRAAVPPAQARHRVTLALDPADANVQVDQLPALKEDFFFDHGSAHTLIAEAPGRVSRKLAFTVNGDMHLAVRLNRFLALPLAADPEPLPLEVAARYPSNPASLEDIGRAFAKLERYAKCQSLLGYTEGAKSKSVASASDVSACVQLLDEANGMAPDMFQLAAAGRAYLQAASSLPDGVERGSGGKVLASFRAQFLAVLADWQREELARLEKDEGRGAAWQLRALALHVQLWCRQNRARPGARARDANRAVLERAFDDLRGLTQQSPELLAKIGAAEAFLKAAAEVLVLASQPRGKPDAELRACRDAVVAFNGSIVE